MWLPLSWGPGRTWDLLTLSFPVCLLSQFPVLGFCEVLVSTLHCEVPTGEVYPQLTS